MSPRKLSEGDRTQILKLYRETDETSSTLADRYGVSSSTISRILKLSLSQTEYESLIQEKRLARTNSKAKQAKSVESPILKQEDSSQNPEPDKPIPDKAPNNDPEPQKEVKFTKEDNGEQITLPLETSSKPILKQKNSSLAKDEVSPNRAESNNQENDLEEDSEQEDFEANEDLESVKTLKAMFGEDIADEDEDDDFDDEDDEGDVDELESTPSIEDIKVLPLSSAKFRRNCYLAIDRTSELMTRPLKDFAELGKIPQEEVNQKTLPVFDNHRVAKRFCDRKGKVIKVPDTQVIEKTISCLQSKGITRLLMNGKVFDLLK